MGNQRSTILVVDDELSIRESFNLIFEDKYKVITAASGEAALKKLVDEKVDVVYLDIRMPGMDGMETLKRLRQIDKDATVIMVTAVNDVQNAGQAIKLGAKNYVVKPFDVEAILSMTETLLKKKTFSRETREIRSGLSAEDEALIGTSRQAEEIRRIADGIAGKEMNVLITGEAGVEKELLARIIHKASARSSKPFLKFYIGIESSQTLGERLFGSGKGSFVATLQKEKGLLEEANGGTLLLANVENLPPVLQKELANALQKKEFSREGSFVPTALDVRVIAASNSNLKDLASDGFFDKALYEEISEASVLLPALRERNSDIPLFVDHLIQKYNKIYGRSINGLTKDALETLSGYDFPGNVSELDHILEGIVLTFDGNEIPCEKLPLYVLLNSKTFRGVDEGRGLTFENIYEKLENNYIEHVLGVSGSDAGGASEILGLHGSALQSRIESLQRKK